MIPAPFAYERPASVDAAVELLIASPRSRLLAGGQSLIPLLRDRRVEVDTVIDLRDIAELRDADVTDGERRLGALVTHDRAIEALAPSPLAADLRAAIADTQVRNTGTIGGALALGDSAGDWHAVALALDAILDVASPDGRRTARAVDLYAHPRGGLGEAELLTSITIREDPLHHRAAAYERVPHLTLSGALASCAVRLDVDSSGRVAGSRVAVSGAAVVPQRLAAAEDGLEGCSDPLGMIAAVRAAAEAVEVKDIGVGRDYASHLLGVVSARALARAWQRHAGYS